MAHTQNRYFEKHRKNNQLQWVSNTSNYGNVIEGCKEVINYRLGVDIPNTIIGAGAAILTGGGIWTTVWAARKYGYKRSERNSAAAQEGTRETDVEMGNLEESPSIPTTPEDESESLIPRIPPANSPNHRQHLLRIFGQTLVSISAAM
ncbi:hypothetical protein NA56DRAFT_661622 [Hyaloscypha hepaticicola]|uniref:Uncharacterized protein n=1 Tax=Hyaloscypha hepaticicola TaxID=2082293 RepID=A0A2J6PWL0_9HELO|nr:hypothetical protein NA56DRAFT_661622 [Hyaloscypha hepaticicola]